MGVVELFGDLAERRIFRDPGIGEDDIQPAFVLFDDRENAVEIVEVRHVAVQGFDVFADGLDGGRQFRLATSGDEDIGAFRDKTPWR